MEDHLRARLINLYISSSILQGNLRYLDLLTYFISLQKTSTLRRVSVNSSSSNLTLEAKPT